MEKDLPQARKDELLIHELGDETLIYDLQRHRAHSLNSSAALVWRCCDGSTRPSDMAARLQQELGLPADEELVWFALRRLQRAHLLQEKVGPSLGAAQPSRRELMRRLGMVGGLAIALPLVESIIARPAYAQASCGTQNADCSETPCCAGCRCQLADGKQKCVGGC